MLSLSPLFPGTNELDQVAKIHKILGTPGRATFEKLKKHSNTHIDFNFPQYEATGIAKMIPHTSAECVDLIEKLIDYDPDTRLSARQALRRLWRAVRLVSGGLGVVLIGFSSALIAIDPASANNPIAIGFIAFGALLLACALVTTPRNRGRLHRRLGRLGGRGSEEEEAAAVAALVGGADAEKALAKAAELFCCLPASSLVADDLAGYYPNEKVDAAELRKKTEPASLGEVTCFVSHSFQDELPENAPGAKYKAIARWARRHEERTGVEATIWLCKACIDKENLDVSLACLPVFLAGCQHVLVAAGPTYTGRLWVCTAPQSPLCACNAAHSRGCCA